MNDQHPRLHLATDPNPAGDTRTAWERQAGAVPPEWATPAYRIDQAPYRQLFTQNANYQPGRTFDFGPGHHARMRAETGWWLWTCWRDGLRKVEPSMLRWWATALDAMANTRTGLTGRSGHSIADFDPALVTREAVRAFVDRNHRTPSAGNLRNLTSIAAHAHLLVSVRCSDAPWWAHDTWNLRVDDRIPRRAHEPAGHHPLSLAGINPPWLREGVRFWLRTAISTQLYRWTTAVTRATTIATYFTPWVAAHSDTVPALADTDAELREAFLDYLAWLRSPAAAAKGTPLRPSQVDAITNHIQGFYRFMLDHADLAAHATGNPDWAALTEAHARLWAPTYTRRRTTRDDRHQQGWIAAADMARMVSVLDILAGPTDQQITVYPPGQDPITAPGLGDPQAARAWLLQALTGRRVSEILMMDYDPLTPIPGVDPATAGPDAFIARLRYQQTKVDGVDPAILVDAAVVTVVRDQQAFAAGRVESGATPRHLFLEPRHNHRGLRPRPYPSHQAALRRLDELLALTDTAGKPLKFTQTHRLRHTRATDLLNAGVPVHVVQRYLGHRSPEMTMRYAATLAETAEAEFLKAKRAGSFGVELTVDAADLYEITQLSGRTDRILPNGACLLPPTSNCDRGNACLTCGHFATDTTHLPDLHAQHRRTLELIDIRQAAFTARHGCPMPEANVWLAARRRELSSLDAIRAALTGTGAVTGAGVTARTHPEKAPEPP